MKIQLIILSLLVCLVSACEPNSGATASAGQADGLQQSGVRTEVIRSPHRGMGKIPITHRVLSAQQLGVPITVQIEFSTQPNQMIAVEYRPSETLSVSSDVAVDVQSDNHGRVSLLVDLEATMPGKAYLKLFVYALDGSMASSTAIALNIADQEGKTPQQQPGNKQRIDLPGASF